MKTDNTVRPHYGDCALEQPATHTQHNQNQSHPTEFPFNIDLSRADFGSEQSSQRPRGINRIDVIGSEGSAAMNLPGLAHIDLANMRLAIVGNS